MKTASPRSRARASRGAPRPLPLVATDAARLLLFAATVLIPFQDLGKIGSIGARPFEAALLLAALLALPGLVADHSWARLRALDREVVAVVLLGLLALLVARGPGESVRSFRLVIAEPALYYLLVTRLMPGRAGAWRLAQALALGGALAAALAFGQVATQEGLIEAEGVDRVRAAYPSPNNLALFLDRVVPLGAAMALGGGGPFWWIVALATGAALALTFSVGGWLATAAGLALVIYLVRGRRALLALAGLGIVGGGALAALRLERVLSHLDFSGGDSTSSLRLYVWRSALAMLRDHPIFGIGLDNFVYLYNPARGGSYMDPAAWREPDLSHPHNLFLDWWLSLGLLGFVLLLWLLYKAWHLARRAWAASPGDRALAAGLIGGLAAGLLHGLIDNSFFLPDLAVLWWLGLALLAALGEPQARGS